MLLEKQMPGPNHRPRPRDARGGPQDLRAHWGGPAPQVELSPGFLLERPPRPSRVGKSNHSGFSSECDASWGGGVRPPESSSG